MVTAHKILRDSLILLKLMSHTTWGSETETLIKIFKSTIQVKLHCGSI